METSSTWTLRQTRKRKQSNCVQEIRNKRVAYKCPIETVFGIEPVLETILENLKTQDLLRCRGVNKQWNYCSTKTLLRNQSLKVTLKFQDKNNKNDELKLTAFTETMETNRKLNLPFPLRNFVFYNCDLSNRAFRHLLSTFGHMIRSLDIFFGNRSLPKVKRRSFLLRFKQFVLDKLPNMEELAVSSKTCAVWGPKVHENFKKRSVGGRSSESACYPKLKTLCVLSRIPRHVFEFLIQAGVNIKDIELGHSYHFNERHAGLLRSRNKTHLLTSAFINFRRNNLNLIDHLVKAKPHLKFFRLFLYPSYYLDNYWLRATAAVATLLNACASTLETLEANPFSVFPEFEIPLMPRLRLLYIVVPGDCLEVFLPTKRFKISKVFPRLEVISLTYESTFSEITTQELYGNDFLGADYEDTALSVKTVEFNREPELYCIQGLPRLFTNLKTVRISNLSNISEVVGCVWVLPVIEVVFLSVSIQKLNTLESTRLNTNACTALDSALTGIPQEMSVTLPISEKLDATTVNNFRSKKSMLDAKSLRLIIIEIEDNSTKKRSRPTKAILSTIARKYAFEMCRQVEVGILLVTKRQENLKFLIGGVSSVLKNLKKMEEKQINNTVYDYYLPPEPTSYENLALYTTKR